MIKQLRQNSFWVWMAFLLLFVTAGLYGASQVFLRGLEVTNLTDLAPWGLWITLDLSSVALAAGAFSLSAMAYLMGRESYKGLAQIAFFIGILGDGGALMSLLMDIGRPDRFWHGWVFWNVNSMLWLVTICLTLYLGVLVLEVFPMFVELPFLARFKRLTDLAHRIHGITPVLAIAGLGVSLLHQSSLGATYGVVAGRAALARATMPLLFIVSAVAAGIAFTILITLIIQWIKKRILVPRQVLFEAGQVAGAILLVYLFMRFWDSTAGNYGYVPGRTEAERTMTSGAFAAAFWAWEITLGGLIAAILLIGARRFQNITMLLVGAGFTMAGLIANRWDTTMLAFTEPLSTSPALTDPLVTIYTPSAVEWMTSIGIVAGLTLVFSLGVRYLPAFNGHMPRRQA
jgi:Ni/Fe-hydrogenase subunit HybB-like protein